MVENRLLQLNQHPRNLSRLYLNFYTNPNSSSPRLASDRTVSYSFNPSPRSRRLSVSFRVKATTAVESDQPQRWWEKNVPPNMVEIHSTQDFLGALSQAGDKLVVVDFYGTWCGSCRAMFPKFCKIAAEHPEIIFLKVNFDENKSLCKSLNIKVLPYFHIYRGPERLLESFPCTLAKFHKLKDAIATHSKSSSATSPVLEKTSDSTSR